jgi:hypothetical protein
VSASAVRFVVEVYETATRQRYVLRRTAAMVAVPRVGEDVQLTAGGWSEPVKAVWHDLADGSVTVEFATQEYTAAVEDLAAHARAEGWTQ